MFHWVESRDSTGNKIRFHTWWPPEHYLVNVLLFSTKLFKGQLNSKCSNEIILSSKIPTKLFLDFCPEILCTSLGAFWKLFGLLGTLLSNIIIKEAYKKPQKLPGSPQEGTKKFQGRNPEIILLVFWKKLLFHKDILKLTDL